ncbi:transglutaminase-like cysteine peptidase [Pseudoalteromonas sp. A41-2]|uniref:transglutaminase-like cysteine peptidase n=1 Tax=Pseudoalteromonas sp. A41-2 TaxID=2785910 RepID=UPI0018CBC0B4|nr:transglutaminase-like cysteine peptidase [Pseudoalteromonas sp. A41-2]QPL43700.1 transglutaminase-like cysteine peptidase [Pseudoalteromonas sp. A41-2]
MLSKGIVSACRFAWRYRFFSILFFLVLCLTSVALAERLVIEFSTFIQQMQQRYGANRVTVARQWQGMLQHAAGLPEQQQILVVNDFFARTLRYQTDIELWKQNDYWATPLETMGKGLGDCEDYAIAKYVSLRALGISDDKLRLIYVKAQLPGTRQTQAHMVLGYFTQPNTQPLILDSLIVKVLPAAKRTDLSPVFSFNSKGLWANNSTQSVADPTARLSRWRHILEQTRKEGVKW